MMMDYNYRNVANHELCYIALHITCKVSSVNKRSGSKIKQGVPSLPAKLIICLIVVHAVLEK